TPSFRLVGIWCLVFNWLHALVVPHVSVYFVKGHTRLEYIQHAKSLVVYRFFDEISCEGDVACISTANPRCTCRYSESNGINRYFNLSSRCRFSVSPVLGSRSSLPCGKPVRLVIMDKQR